MDDREGMGVTRMQSARGIGNGNQASAVFGPEAGEEEYRRFVSARAQLLNQSPELVNC